MTNSQSPPTISQPNGQLLSPPIFGKTVNVSPVYGTVFLRFAGSLRYARLLAGKSVPFGTIIDARHGRVRICTSRGPGGGVQCADFYGGLFRVSQGAFVARARVLHRFAVVELVLLGGSFRTCRLKARGAAMAAAVQRRSVRHLWGSGKGNFRTRGRYGAATVRGTIWLTSDGCEGTVVRVRRGVVAVSDFARHRTVRVTAGHRYLARAR